MKKEKENNLYYAERMKKLSEDLVYLNLKNGISIFVYF